MPVNVISRGEISDFRFGRHEEKLPDGTQRHSVVAFPSSGTRLTIVARSKRHAISLTQRLNDGILLIEISHYEPLRSKT